MTEQAGGDGESTLQVEQVLSDRYKVEADVRHSVTCHLFRVLDVFRNVRHLILCPSPRTLQDEAAMDWFVQFCRNALSVPHHPNLLTCRRMDYDHHVPYLVMDDVEGTFWDKMIKKGELSDLSTMLNVAIQVGRGLEWLHENGRIHANMKPANVMIEDRDGMARVLKYGETDAFTRAYASPEQVAGERPLTAATDVWCWGVSVLHMFAGIVNWSLGAKAPKALRRYLRHGPAIPSLALMPVPVVQLLESCFRTRPGDRPGTMADVVEEMEEIYRDVTNEPYPTAEIDDESADEGYESEHLVELQQPGSQSQATPEQPPARRRFSPSHQSSDHKGRRGMRR